MFNKKGQISISDAPSVVMIVGLVFLTMATVAFIGLKYGQAMPSDNAGSVVNETLTTVTETGEYVSNSTACNFEDFTIVYVTNATNKLITSGNYTTATDGKISAVNAGIYNNTNWKVTYTYNYAGTACDVTQDLNTEIGNNTSIAGIVLTISLVGIILSVLIGVFVIARNRGM